MSKRLQVLLEEAELREIQRFAQRKQLSVADWVRQVLRLARRAEASGDPGRKLDTLRAAARHRFPTADIDQMLAETESGYLGSRQS